MYTHTYYIFFYSQWQKEHKHHRWGISTNFLFLKAKPVGLNWNTITLITSTIQRNDFNMYKVLVEMRQQRRNQGTTRLSASILRHFLNQTRQEWQEILSVDSLESDSRGQRKTDHQHFYAFKVLSGQLRVLFFVC